MKTYITRWIPIFLAFVSIGSYASQLPDEPFIHVESEGVMNVKPDGVSIAVLVAGFGKTAVDARASVDRRVSEAVRVLEEFAVSGSDLDVFGLSVVQQKDYDVDPPAIMGYDAEREVIFRVRDFDKAAELLEALLEVGIAEVTEVQPIVDNLAEVEHEALELAFENAKRRAQSLAELSGRKLGKVFSVTPDGYRLDRLERVVVTGSRLNQPIIQLHEFEVSQTVEVVFYLD